MNSIQPFEPNNIIFIDTEFSSLDPSLGEILSIGIVKLDGTELYIELEQSANLDCDAWVIKHILPTLKAKKVSALEAQDRMRVFIGETAPYAIAFVDNYDALYFVKLFGVGKLPFRWLTIDMASILFAQGINPVKFLPSEPDAKSFYKKLNINVKKFKHHHALDDARLLREVWLKLVNNNEQ